jgi:hypothetical protein
VQLIEEWKRAQAAKPHTYDRKDSLAIPVAFDEQDSAYQGAEKGQRRDRHRSRTG